MSIRMATGSNPTKPSSALGVWWPGTTSGSQNEHLRRLPLSDSERQLAHYKQRESGLELYTKIGGHAVSSTRTELAAAITALSAHGPVHLASDSNAFVSCKEDDMCNDGR